MPATTKQHLPAISHNQPSYKRDETRVVVTHLDQLPVEGGVDPMYGDVTWRTLFSADRTPTTDLLLGVADFKPFGELHHHYHAAAEFYFGLSGSGVVTVDSVEYEMAAGVAVYIPADVVHGILAGENGLSIAYGFAKDSFSDIDYVFTDRGLVTGCTG